jgi:hypothetical protein
MADEKYGIEDLKPLATAMGQLAALGYGLFVEKTGVWPLLFGIQSPVNAIGHFFSADVLAKAGQEVLDLSEAERKELEAALIAPMQPAFQAKILPGEALFDKCVAFVLKNIDLGKQDVSDIKSIVEDFKALFGL